MLTKKLAWFSQVEQHIDTNRALMARAQIIFYRFVFIIKNFSIVKASDALKAHSPIGFCTF